MATFIYKNFLRTADVITDDIRRGVIRDYLTSQRSDGTSVPVIEDSEIDALLAAYDTGQAAEQAAEQAATDFRALPNWATWTGTEAADALRTGILNGMTKEQTRAAIDAQFAGVTNLAQLGAATVAILKQLSDAVIDGRDLGHQNEARAIMFLRDVVIK